MKLVLIKFQQFMKEQYSVKILSFLKRMGDFYF